MCPCANAAGPCVATSHCPWQNFRHKYIHTYIYIYMYIHVHTCTCTPQTCASTHTCIFTHSRALRYHGLLNRALTHTTHTHACPLPHVHARARRDPGVHCRRCPGHCPREVCMAVAVCQRVGGPHHMCQCIPASAAARGGWERVGGHLASQTMHILTDHARPPTRPHRPCTPSQSMHILPCVWCVQTLTLVCVGLVFGPWPLTDQVHASHNLLGLLTCACKACRDDFVVSHRAVHTAPLWGRSCARRGSGRRRRRCSA